MNDGSSKSILVTGGSGFIGSHLVRGLHAAGHKVKVFSRRPSIYLLNDIKDDIEIIQFDFSIDLESLSNHLEGVQIVYHLAWSNLPRRGNNYLVNDILNSGMPSLELIRLCSVSPTLEKFIFTSSGGTVYGDVPEAIHEETPLNPISTYGLTKVIVEKSLYYFKYHNNLDYVVLRVANAFGPRDPEYIRQGVISTWLKAYYKGSALKFYGDGNQIRDYIYITDIVKALTIVMNKKCDHSVYNLGSGVGHSLSDILNVLEDCLNQKLNIQNIQFNKHDVNSNILDTDRFKSEFDWAAECSLKEGISQMINFYKGKL